MKAQGQRILSELNDLKRTIKACANELGWNLQEVENIIKGETTPDLMEAFIKVMCETYPVNRADLEINADDTRLGIKIMHAAASKKSARIFERHDRYGNLTPYYEYRDTATSRLCAFRPEWIKELRVVNDKNSQNPDVIYNNGHFMHQITFFVGPVNFYYDINGHKTCEIMSTGDSNYITPYFPHSFTSRNVKEEAYIVAVTFGGDVHRALNELYRMGKNRASKYLINTKNTMAGVQDLLDYHLKNELLTRDLLQKRLKVVAQPVDIMDRSKTFSLFELEAIADHLGVEVTDLTLPPHRQDEVVVVKKRVDVESYYFPSNEKAHYKIWPGARCRMMPLVKSFNIEILSNASLTSPEFENGLYTYVFNYSSGTAMLFWRFEKKIYSEILEPEDSVCIQPFIPYGYRKHSPHEDVKLFSVSIPSSINLSVQREMSGFATFDRVASEDKCWF